MERGVCKHKDCQVYDMIGLGTCNNSHFQFTYKL